MIEVRTGDRAGLLYALGRALSEIRLSIRSAHISTLAGQAIDTFYVTEPDGSPPSPSRGPGGGRCPDQRRQRHPAAPASRTITEPQAARASRLDPQLGQVRSAIGRRPPPRSAAGRHAASRRSRRRPRRAAASSKPQTELDPAVQEASHERVAGADGVDHLGREAGHPRDVATGFHGGPAAGTERDHRQPEPVLLDPVPAATSTGSPPPVRAPLASALARNLMSSSLALTMPCRRPTTRSQGCTLVQYSSGSVITVGRTLMS